MQNRLMNLLLARHLGLPDFKQVRSKNQPQVLHASTAKLTDKTCLTCPQGAAPTAAFVSSPENYLGLAGRRRDCHCTNIPSASILKRLLKGEGGAAE